MRVRLLHAIPVTVVVAVIIAGAVFVSVDRWRLGSGIFACAAAAGALMRLVLPTRAVGTLAVRSRAFDVAMFTAMAALLAGMALVTVTPHT